MTNLLLAVYLANATLLIVHQIDSAYWKEWNLFHLPGGEAGFALLHIPLLLPVLGGVLLIGRGALAGAILSLAVSLCGLLAFAIHMFFLSRGHPEFRTSVSLGILWSTLVLSVAQLGLTVSVLA